MAMRISKYVPIFGIGVDTHNAIPPNWVALPPAPPVPSPFPANRWLVTCICQPTAMLTGKWTLPRTATEGMGDILWQYDWGPLQLHWPIGPVFLSPAGTIVLTLGSSIKYWVPSFAVQEGLDGGSIAMMSPGKVAVACSYPVFLIPTQDCQDIGGAAFVAPTSISFQMVSTRWVGFNWGDLCAGLLGMAGDALLAFAVSKLGGRLLPGTLADNQLLGGLAGNAMNVLAGLLGGTAGQGPFLGGLGLGVGGGVIAGFGAGAAGSAIGGIGLAVAGSWLLQQAATNVGGPPRPSDTGDTATPPPAVPPPSTTAATAPPPQGSGMDAGAPSGTGGGQSGSPSGPPPPPPASTSSSSSSSGTPDPNACDPNDPNTQ
ncbi:MAG: hypothetical protein LAP39_10120 [Acidobacteriia bacterium]|nr:hypothetical protein [Terriglobia bacterium]